MGDDGGGGGGGEKCVFSAPLPKRGTSGQRQ